jgi:short-subunit dehydrogenase
MKPRRTGHIINLSSAVSKVVGSDSATYCATKFAVAGFSEAIALELRGTGVEISVVRPSLCRTDLTSGFEGLPGMPFVEPDDVAARIVETLARPRFEVPVPKRMGAMLWLNQALPYRARAAFAHLSHADAVMSRIDADERAAYDERVKEGAGS